MCQINNKLAILRIWEDCQAQPHLPCVNVVVVVDGLLHEMSMFNILRPPTVHFSFAPIKNKQTWACASSMHIWLEVSDELLLLSDIRCIESPTVIIIIIYIAFTKPHHPPPTHNKMPTISNNLCHRFTDARTKQSEEAGRFIFMSKEAGRVLYCTPVAQQPIVTVANFHFT